MTTDTDARTLSLEAGYDRLAGLMTACPCNGITGGCAECGIEMRHSGVCFKCKGTGKVALLPGLRAGCLKCGAAYGHEGQDDCCGPWPHGGPTDNGCHGKGWVPVRDLATLLAEMRKAGWLPFVEGPLVDRRGVWHWITRAGIITQGVKVEGDDGDEAAAVRAAVLATEAL